MFIKSVRFFIFTLLFSFSVTATASNAFAAEKSESKENKTSQSKIKVESGDTIYSIARKYNIRVQDLVQLNKLTKPYSLKSAQILSLPQNQVHAVKEGDTVYAIARSYRVNVKEIIELNKLKAPYKINGGTRILIPSNGIEIKEAASTLAKEKVPEPKLKETAKTPDSISKEEKKKLVKNGLSAEPYDPNIRNVISKDLDLLENKKSGNSKKDEKSGLGVKKSIQETPPKTAQKETGYTKASYENGYNTPFIEGKGEEEKNVKDPFIEQIAEENPIKNTESSPKINIAKDIDEINNQKKEASQKDKKEESYTSIADEVSSGPANFVWPVKGKVISRFGPKQGGLYNDGINIMAKDGEAIKAADSGVVVYSGNELRGYGNLILIKHNNGYLTAYAHLKDMLINKGDSVKKGQTIAYVGDTGHVSQPQLHFSIRNGRKAVDPEKYLSRTFTSR